MVSDKHARLHRKLHYHSEQNRKRIGSLPPLELGMSAAGDDMVVLHKKQSTVL